MRRTSAGKLLAPVGAEKPWAEIPCDGCPTVGIKILASSITANGAMELGFCGPACATLHGWPWLRAERDRAPIVGQASLFEAAVHG